MAVRTLLPRRRSRLFFATVVALLVVLAPVVANAAGYPTALPKRVNIAYFTAALSSGGSVGFDLKTNVHGQITQVIAGTTRLPSVVCPGQQPIYLDTNGDSQLFGGGSAGIFGVSPSGNFSYRENFLDSPYTMTVTGHLSARGQVASGVVTIVSATPGTIAGVSGCVDPTSPKTYSRRVHWEKFPL